MIVSWRDARRALAAVVATGWLLLAAAPAWAHASFVSASPGPGLGLPQAPAAVVLRFDEPLNLRLSRIEVVDEAGADVTAEATRAVEGDARAMQRPLGLLTPGRYRVRWTSVSTLDGHALHGSYAFGVGTAAVGDEQVRASPLASEGWLGLAGRLVALVGLVLWAGHALLAGVAERAGVPTDRLSLLRRMGPWLTLVGTVVSVVSSALVATGSVTAVVDVLGSRSGAFRGALLLAAGIGAARPRVRHSTNRLLAGAAILAEAASGHAAATEVVGLATVSAAAHLAAVGVWVYALAAALASRERLSRALDAFTPAAVRAALIVAGTGALNAVVELAKPADLWLTGYGRTVTGKTVALGAMAVLGVTHHRRRRSAAPAPRVLGLARAELAAAGVALALAVVLVAFPNPPRDAAVAGESASGDVLTAGLVGAPAVSVAEASGPFVVALSLLPPEPGPVQVRLSIDGVEAGDGVRQARVTGTSAHGARFSADLVPCGLGCFRGDGTLPAVRGPGDAPKTDRWAFQATATSNRGPIAMRVELAVPAPDGSAELARMLTRMQGLRSARVREELRGAQDMPPVVSQYAFAAPDAMRFDVEGVSSLIVVGARAFDRDGAGGPWQPRNWGPPAFSWPVRFYDEFWGQHTAAVRIVGQEPVDGVPCNVLTFLRADVGAWFRVWVGIDDGLVRRMEMRTRGHLMDQQFHDLGAPLDITLPI